MSNLVSMAEEQKNMPPIQMSDTERNNLSTVKLFRDEFLGLKRKRDNCELSWVLRKCDNHDFFGVSGKCDKHELFWVFVGECAVVATRARSTTNPSHESCSSLLYSGGCPSLSWHHYDNTGNNDEGSMTKMTGRPGQTRPLTWTNMALSWEKICKLIFFQILCGIWWHWVSRGHYLLVLGGTGSVLGGTD